MLHKNHKVTNIEAIETIPGSYGNDPFQNVITYVKKELDVEQATPILEFINRIRDDVDKNRTPDLRFNVVIDSLPPEHRKAVGALIRDIEVFLLECRYDLLRRLRDPSISSDELSALLDRYCLNGTYQVDPEVPKIVVRLIVQHFSEWDLACLFHDPVRNALQVLRNPETTPESRRRVFGKLGNLIRALRWVPYDWVEDILISFLRDIPTNGRTDQVRLFTSVLRAAFTRPLVHTKSVTAILDTLTDRFGGSFPVSLMGLLRAICVSGGSGVWDVLKQRMLAQPESYADTFFLETMLIIDRWATSNFIAKNRVILVEKIGPADVLSILARTGERSEAVVSEFIRYWGDADHELRSTIISAIDDLHCTRSCGFLTNRLAEEHDRGLQLRMIDTIGHTAPLGEVCSLPSAVRELHPLAYYHAIDVTYRRLTADPVNLTTLQEYSVLRELETARSGIYRMYRGLAAFERLLQVLSALEEVMPEGQHLQLNEAFEPLVSKSLLENDDIRSRVEQVKNARREHFEYFAMHETVARLLEAASDFNPRYSDDVFGRTRTRFPWSKVIHRNDLAGVFTKSSTESLVETLQDLLRKTERSMMFLREYFLYKEWFVRPAPYVLGESIPETIENIAHKRDMSFNPGVFELEQKRTELRRVFRIHAECTRQGVYLTETLVQYLLHFSEEEVPRHVAWDFTHRRSQLARGEVLFDPANEIDRDLVFTSFAHIYRYGKESVDRPSIVYLWLRFIEAAKRIQSSLTDGCWPWLPRHPHLPPMLGPLVQDQYNRHRAQARMVRDFVVTAYRRMHPKGFRIRVIPNITYGLFCLAPILPDILQRGIHLSLAGISSRYCDDMNISEFSLSDSSVTPLKPYLFSTASNFGTLNRDRILIVVDGTMEPIDRRRPDRMRLPKAHRGYLNHIVAVNYVRSKYGYGMDNPEREVASALDLPERYVKNLVRTVPFRMLERTLLLSFNRDSLLSFQKRMNTGRTYYGFAQWNPDGLTALSSSRGFPERDIPCAEAESVTAPLLLFVSMSGVFREKEIPAFFDNKPEVEKARIVLGPEGVRLDTGWPHRERGIEVLFPEGENR